MDDIPCIMEAFNSRRFYINRTSVKEAINSQFNVLDTEEGDKIDFWILTESNFDKSRFSRRQKIELFSFNAYITAPEDTIVQKLLWSKLSGGSKKQYEDALSIFELQCGNLDIEYMDYWSKELDIENLYRKMMSDAEIDDRD